MTAITPEDDGGPVDLLTALHESIVRARDAARQDRPEPRPEAVAAVEDAVRLVEDAIDATSDYSGTHGPCRVTSERTGLAVVEALVEAGWTPPEPAP